VRRLEVSAPHIRCRHVIEIAVEADAEGLADRDGIDIVGVE
jgi:hypothetical protein